MKTMSKQQLDAALAERLQYEVGRLNNDIERTLLGPVAPNATTHFNTGRFRRVAEIKALAVISWYIEEYGVLLREDLRSQHLQNLKDQEVLWVLLHSKDSMLDWLATFSERIIFGNLVPLYENTCKRLYFVSLLPRPARRVVRRRGYRDHGSCRPQHRWLPTEDWSLDAEMDNIEKRRDWLQGVSLTIARFGLLGVRLPEAE